jgi:hypothetical protein
MDCCSTNVSFFVLTLFVRFFLSPSLCPLLSFKLLLLMSIVFTTFIFLDVGIFCATISGKVKVKHSQAFPSVTECSASQYVTYGET